MRFRAFLALGVLAASSAVGAAPALAAEAATPRIGSIRPIPANFSVRARDLSPLETGWSWTERVVGVEARIRTTLEMGVAAKLSGKTKPVRFWHKRVEFIQAGQSPRTGAVVAVAYGKTGSVLAIGEFANGNHERRTELYDPPRLLIPATVRADTKWESGGIERHVLAATRNRGNLVMSAVRSDRVW